MTEKKGCQITLWVVMGLIGLGLVGTGLFQSFMAGQEQQGQRVVALVVSGKEITAEDYNNALGNERDRIQQNQMAALQLQFGGPTAQLDLIGNTLDLMIRQGLVSTIASQNNVKVTEEGARKAWEAQVETQILQIRNQILQNDPALAADEAKYNEAFKAQTGQTPAEIRKTAMEDFEDEIKGENRQELFDSFIGPIVLDHFAASSTKTEADVKASYDTYFVNRLALTDPEKSSDEMLTKAEEAREALVGGTPYAEVYKKYVPGSDTVPTPAEYTRGNIEANEPMKPLLDLEQGQVSQPIQEGGAWVVYQVVKIENKLPANYEQQKEQLLIDARRNDAANTLTDRVEEMMESAVEWKSSSLEAAYKTYLALTANQNDLNNSKLRELIDNAEAAMGDAIVGATPAVFAKYAALNALVSRVTPTEKEELMPEWIEVHQQVLGQMESSTLRLALADLYFESDQGELGAAVMLEAIQNTPVEDQMGQFVIQEVESKLKDEETSKKIPADMKTQIEDAITTWRADQAAYTQEMEEAEKEMAKDMEELNKEMEEEQRKQEEAEGAATGGAEGATTGTTTPESTTTGGDKPEGQ